MKKKLSLSISIGCVALILSLLMFTQFKTVQETDITAIETMRETELRTELANWKTKYEEIEEKLEDTNSKIEEYKSQMDSEEDATALLNQELQEANKLLGYTDVTGEGIIITLEDNEENSIVRFDIIDLVNELKLAGAEAISINDERIVSITDITVPTNNIFLINGRRTTSPYVVKAIGDKKYLESAITIKGGYLDTIEASEKTISYTVEDSIVINKYEGTLSIEYMTVEESD